MTPLEFTAIMTGKAWARDEAEKARVSLAWYVEGFARTKRLPDLELLLSGGELPEQSAGDMLEVLLVLKNAGAVMKIEERKDPPWAQQ